MQGRIAIEEASAPADLAQEARAFAPDDIGDELAGEIGKRLDRFAVLPRWRCTTPRLRRPS